MKKMAASNVLIVGLKGLGVEIGNAVPTLYDPYAYALLSKEHCPRWSEICHHLRPRTRRRPRPELSSEWSMSTRKFAENA